MKSPQSPESIMEFLHSIQNVRLDEDGHIEIQFVEGENNSILDNRWKTCDGYIRGTFAAKLFTLIEDALAGKLEDGDLAGFFKD